MSSVKETYIVALCEKIAYLSSLLQADYEYNRDCLLETKIEEVEDHLTELKKQLNIEE